MIYMAKSLEDNKELNERFEKYTEYVWEKTDVVFDSDGAIKEIKIADDFVEDEALLEEIDEFFYEQDILERQPVNLNNLEDHTDAQVLDFITEELFVGMVLDNEVKEIGFYSNEFCLEFNEGGISQYLVNTKGEHISQLIYALECLGAVEYAEAFEEFVEDNDVTAIDFDEEYCVVGEIYGALQNKIEKLNHFDPLADYIIKFVRENHRNL